MGESVPVRCPACGREHVHTVPSYPCVCGTSTTLRPDPAAVPAALAHRTWDEDWVTVPCASCGRRNQWPQPELGCSCGTLLRLPVAGAGAPPRHTSSADRPGAATRRPAFQPVTIRTALDAVTTAALYLRWLGYGDIRRADQRPPSGIGLAAPGLVAQVDPTVRPAAPRDVECLWLTAMTESACGVYFSLAGFTEDARARADTLGVPLFVLDLTGTPTPVNGPGVRLTESGAARPAARGRGGGDNGGGTRGRDGGT
ncbi:hypothetical protein OIB37_29070 [Streptomyces sp. NBC_00820]|uniref:hypothetical protein n=1 Tax=Streptomyces sp. NBC_00820 TaxID=2975842 RepID=UPI002ED2289B|nr:hypothetical protein OIB37_29070 [Streptomyces sp. NBC_00820]